MIFSNGSRPHTLFWRWMIFPITVIKDYVDFVFCFPGAPNQVRHLWNPPLKNPTETWLSQVRPGTGRVFQHSATTSNCILDFFLRLIRPRLVAMGMIPAADQKKILGPRGHEPWIGLGFAQLPLFVVAQISDPLLTLQS